MTVAFGKKRPIGVPLINLTLFTLLGIALVGAVVLIFSTVEAERAQRTHVRRTTEILQQLNNIGRAAINAETAQRGYYITLDQRYLDPYRMAREQYHPAIARLRQLVGDHPSAQQAQLVSDIEGLSDAKFSEIDQSVAQISRGELIAAQRQILTDQGQEMMTRLRYALTQMEQIESRDLARATENAAAVEARVLPLLGLLLLMLLGSLGLGYWQVTRAARAAALEAYAEELAEANDRAELLTRLQTGTGGAPNKGATSRCNRPTRRGASRAPRGRPCSGFRRSRLASDGLHQLPRLDVGGGRVADGLHHRA